MPAQRSQDGHDVLATYRQLVNLGTRAPSEFSIGEFEEEIKARHADLMSGRQENAPGHYKQEPNAAGNTLFVLPGRVRGTLYTAAHIEWRDNIPAPASYWRLLEPSRGSSFADIARRGVA